MMAHVMGLRDEGALKHAADLGIAMQLTNIAGHHRGCLDGANLPALAWLSEARIAPEAIAAPENREKLAILTRRLLREAERYYRSGDEGLWHLSFRSACAVAAARNVYSEIGALLLKKGARAWDERTYVTGARKLRVVLRGILKAYSAQCRRGYLSRGRRRRCASSGRRPIFNSALVGNGSGAISRRGC